MRFTTQANWRKTILHLAWALFLNASAWGQPSQVPPQNIDQVISLGNDPRHTLWIPHDYQPANNRVDLLLDFHGHPPTVRSSARWAARNCVVVSVKYQGLSSVYRVPFAKDRQRLDGILQAAMDALRERAKFGPATHWGKMVISSFSAGFGAVREILKRPQNFERIDGILMLDSLYCGYVGDGTDEIQEGIVHPGLMKDFVRFAQASARGEKVMIVTHCMEPTPGYASTRETADYLLGKLKIKATPVDGIVRLPAGANDPGGELRLYRMASKDGFTMYGSPGMGTTDHVLHMRHMAHWLREMPLTERTND